MIGQLAYRVFKTKVLMKNLNSDLFITLIPTFQISLDLVDLFMIGQLAYRVPQTKGIDGKH